jgi:hypothetical protein
MSFARSVRRKAQKAGRDLNEPGQTITLQNPVADHFESFIFGNCAFYQQTFKAEPPMVQQDAAKGEHLVICGAGPSLRDHADEYCSKGSQVWGCNSAAIWLHENGHRVTHGFTVDQTPAMANEWERFPSITALIATSVHPFLVEHLVAKGRPLQFFHNYVGIRKPPVAYDGMVSSYEDWLYAALYPR